VHLVLIATGCDACHGNANAQGAGPSKGAGKAEGSSALAQAESKGKARQQILAGLFSRSWNKVKPGQDRATE
jgi:mono/diheme cytochrome c family protein